MLGGSCSPCCGICKLYEPADDMSVYAVPPYLPFWNGTWIGQPGDFQPNGGSPQMGGTYTLTLLSFSGTRYRYRYMRTDNLAPQFGLDDMTIYNAWVSQSPRPNVTQFAIVSRSVYIEVDLYPLGATPSSPPKTIATNEKPPTFGRPGDLCGLADFYFRESATIRWSQGLVSSHDLEIHPSGRLLYSSQHNNPTLTPVWTGGGLPPSQGSDGVDRTQYGKWTYDTAYALPGTKRPLTTVFFDVEYRNGLYAAPSYGAGLFTVEI